MADSKNLDRYSIFVAFLLYVARCIAIRDAGPRITVSVVQSGVEDDKYLRQSIYEWQVIRKS